MSFVLRHSRRFPVVSPMTYEHWFREGEGIVWNLSPPAGDSPAPCRSSSAMCARSESDCRRANRSRWQRGLCDA